MKFILIIAALLLICSVVLNMIYLKANRLTREENASLKKELDDLRKSIRRSTTVSGSAIAPKRTDTASDSPSKDAASAKSHLLKRKVLALADKYRKHEIDEEDLPAFREEMKRFVDSHPAEPYYKILDLRYETRDRRVVVIGDTHCDFKSLTGILEKLSLSSYDYFEDAYFVFLGDYLDRGRILFENLAVLMGLKQLLGERCIFLKGNHELIEYNASRGILESRVYPADSCPTLNEYCGTDKEFLRKFADYFSNLPRYVLLKTRRGTDLLVHGGIARDAYMDMFTISHDTGEMLVSGGNGLRDNILNNMVWADPRTDRFKMQGSSSRFEFGRDQFEKFMVNNKMDRIFRSHEPVRNGVEAFYDGRLYTIFSNGGVGNDDSNYDEVLNPVFGIVGTDGTIRFESIFFKRVLLRHGVSELQTLLYMGRPAADVEMRLDDLHLNNEFFVINQSF